MTTHDPDADASGPVTVAVERWLGYAWGWGDLIALHSLVLVPGRAARAGGLSSIQW